MSSKIFIPDMQAASASMSGEAPLSAAQRGVATARRRQQDRRDESLRQIRAQIADGTLVVRQMSSAERARGCVRLSSRNDPKGDSR